MEVSGSGAGRPGFRGRSSHGHGVSERIKPEDPGFKAEVVPGSGSAGHLPPPRLCRCWFGKEPGDLVDYIYQGPIILVLLVGPQWELGWGWAPGGLQRTHHRDAGEGCGLEQPLRPPTLCTQYHTAWLSLLLFQHSTP